MFSLGKFSGSYTVTEKVKAQVFVHRYLGEINLSEMSQGTVDKLVITGHLKKTVKSKKNTAG